MRYKAYIIKKEESLKSEPLILKEVDLGVWNGYETVEECTEHLTISAKIVNSELINEDVVILPVLSFDYEGNLCTNHY